MQTTVDPATVKTRLDGQGPAGRSGYGIADPVLRGHLHDPAAHPPGQGQRIANSPRQDVSDPGARTPSW